ncbi:MAG: YdcF family protein [Thiolinea sp.]
MLFKRRLRKLLFWLAAILLSWPVLTGAIIWNFGHTDYAQDSDCIIVLGAAAYHKKPSPVFKERIHHAITLFEAGKAPNIIFTGGYGDGAPYAESEVGAAYAIKNGIPPNAILKETVSRSTRQNLLEAKALMQKAGLQNAIIVSDPLHLKRAAILAEEVGITAVTSPTPTSRFRSLEKKFEFLPREIYFYSRYLLSQII